MDSLVEIMGARKRKIKFLSEISDLSGYLSISFWLFAQIPQVIKNHSDKSVDGFSLGFLLCWFGGDFLNLLSCLLNDAMFFQILLSSYYCIIDMILASQYYYYKNMYHNPQSRWYHHPKKKHKHITSPRESLRDNLQTYGSIDTQIDIAIDNNNINGNRTIKREILELPNYRTIPSNHVKGVFHKQNRGISKLLTSALISGFTKVNSLPIIQDHLDTVIDSNTQEGTNLDKFIEQIKIDDGKANNSIIYKILTFFLTITSYKLGKILAWICTLLYLISRIPQLYTNFKLKSTNGVSKKLICFALCGNLFYSTSLLLCEESTTGGEVSKKFWEAELSYLIGAMGTVLFDFLVLLQWFYYDVKNKYRKTKSGKLKLISPKINKIDNYDYNKKDKNLTSNMAINYSNSKQFKSDPINMNMSLSVKSTLSPNHIKKINEFTPLSPMDFLLDDYMKNQTNSHSNSHINSHINSHSNSHSNHNNNLTKTKISSKSSIHTVMLGGNNNNNNNNNTSNKTGNSHNIGNDELNMSMDEEEEETK